MDKGLRLYIFPWKGMVAFLSWELIVTIATIINIFYPFMEVKVLTSIIMAFLFVGFFILTCFCLFNTYLYLDRENGYFISKRSSYPQLEIPLSEIKQLQFNRNPDYPSQFYIDVLLHDGSVKRVDWNTGKGDSYGWQKDRCTEFIEKCNAILPEYQKK